MDAHSFAACTSPRILAHLGEGSHTLQVRAKDLGGNLDPSPASRSFTVKTAEVKRSGSTLVVTAAPGAKDNLRLTRPSGSSLRVTDLPSALLLGVRDTHRIGLHHERRLHGQLRRLRDHQDPGALRGWDHRVVNSTAVPSSLNGGPGNDALLGGSSNNVLTGGPGADTLKGENGNDALLAHDLASDSLIDYDGGTKPGTADKADLDLLPKDPNSIVHGCETVTRN